MPTGSWLKDRQGESSSQAVQFGQVVSAPCIPDRTRRHCCRRHLGRRARLFGGLREESGGVNLPNSPRQPSNQGDPQYREGHDQDNQSQRHQRPPHKRKGELAKCNLVPLKLAGFLTLELGTRPYFRYLADLGGPRRCFYPRLSPRIGPDPPMSRVRRPTTLVRRMLRQHRC